MGALAQHDPLQATALAEQVIVENLTLDALREILRPSQLAKRNKTRDREGSHNRRDVATSVQNVTIDRQDTVADIALRSITLPEQADTQTTVPTPTHSRQSATMTRVIPDETLVKLLEEAAAALALIAQQREYLPHDRGIIAMLGRIQHDLTSIQQVMPDDRETDALQF